MDRETYARVGAHYVEASELGAKERERYLNGLESEAPEVAAEVRSLLEADEGERSASAAFSERRIEAARAALERAALERALEVEDTEPLGPSSPEWIGPYRVTGRLGQGGMGVVYAAVQDAPRRMVAVKVMSSAMQSRSRTRRFLREAEALGRLHHPNIAQIHDAGTFDHHGLTLPYFTMERVDGVDVRTYAARAGLDTHARLALVAEIANALEHAHQRGVVHRDIKPDNVLVGAGGRPKVLDFGVARVAEPEEHLPTLVTAEGNLLGTVAYMAPEQLSGDPEAVDARADVYALGVLAFELLSGRLPHAVSELPLTAAVRELSDADAPRLGTLERRLRGDVETVVGKALEKDPARRYASAAAFADDLGRVLEHRPIRARPPARAYIAAKFVRRHRGLSVGVASTFIAIVVGLSLYLASESERRAQAERDNQRLALNDARARRAVYRGVQLALEQGLPWLAAEQLLDVDRVERHFEWGYLANQAPWVLDLEAQAPSIENNRYAFLPDGRRIVGILRDGELGIWDVVDGGPPARPFPGLIVRTSRTEAAGARRPLLRLQGWRVAVCTPQGRALVLDLEAPRIVREFTVGDDEYCPSLAPDGTTVVTIEPRGPVRVYRTDRAPLSVPALGDQLGWALYVTFNPREPLAHVTGAEGRIALELNLETGATRELPESLAGSLLVHDPVGTSRLVDATVAPYTAWKPVRELRVLDDQGRLHALPGTTVHVSVSDLDVSPRGRLAARSTERSMEVWDLEARERVEAIRAPAELNFQRMARFGPRGEWLMGVSPVRTLPWIRGLGVPARWVESEAFDRKRLLDSATVTVPHTDWIYQLALSPDGELGASAAPYDPRVRLWSVRTGEQLASLERPTGQPAMQSFLTFDERGDRLLLTAHDSLSAEDLVIEWDLDDGSHVVHRQPYVSRGADRRLSALTAFLERLRAPAGAVLNSRTILHPDGERLILGATWDFAPVELLDASDLSPLRPPFGRTEGIALHPDGRQLATGALDGLVVHDLDRGAQPTATALAGTAGDEIYALAYSHDGTRLAVGRDEGRIQILETRFYELLLDFEIGASPDASPFVYALAWTPDDRRLVGVCGDGLARVWDSVRPELRAREVADGAPAARVEAIRRWSARR